VVQPCSLRVFWKGTGCTTVFVLFREVFSFVDRVWVSPIPVFLG